MRKIASLIGLASLLPMSIGAGQEPTKQLVEIIKEGNIVRIQALYPSGQLREEVAYGKKVIYRQFFDQEGNITKMTIDNDGDGRPDFTKTARYSAGGNLLEKCIDLDGDGRPDLTCRVQYFRGMPIWEVITRGKNTVRRKPSPNYFAHFIQPEGLKDYEPDNCQVTVPIKPLNDAMDW